MHIVIEFTEDTVLARVESPHTLVGVVASVTRTLAMLPTTHANAGAIHMHVVARYSHPAVAIVASAHE